MAAPWSDELLKLQRGSSWPTLFAQQDDGRAESDSELFGEDSSFEEASLSERATQFQADIDNSPLPDLVDNQGPLPDLLVPFPELDTFEYIHDGAFEPLVDDQFLYDDLSPTRGRSMSAGAGFSPSPVAPPVLPTIIPEKVKAQAEDMRKFCLESWKPGMPLGIASGMTRFWHKDSRMTNGGYWKVRVNSRLAVAETRLKSTLKKLAEQETGTLSSTALCEQTGAPGRTNAQAKSRKRTRSDWSMHSGSSSDSLGTIGESPCASDVSTAASETALEGDEELLVLPKPAKKRNTWADPMRPRQPTRPYWHFLKDWRAAYVKPLLAPGAPKLSRSHCVEMGAKRWREMTDEEKRPYTEIHDKEMVEYNKQMDAYKASGRWEAWKAKVSAEEQAAKAASKPADNGVPKKPKKAFMLYLDQLRKEGFKVSGSSREFTKVASAKWAQLSPAEKQVFVDLYQRNLAEYNAIVKQKALEDDLAADLMVVDF